ncbi:ABC transporter substrate-binding protein [Nocardioides sp. KR10-350]|uniref:ABC transporter substrate-binding protein n=1 Tax=Nocardioides cheoyonin TaxID=3156615 RepID=UPI0032B3A43F
MNVRRTAAALLSAGVLLTATACGAGDDLASDDNSPSAGSSGGGGKISIASQNFPEAALVTAMYEELLKNAGYQPSVKLVDTRDAYMATFPGQVDVVPEYVGGIVNFLNAKANGDSAKPFEAGDGEQLAQQGKKLLDDAGITLLDQSSATDTNAFFVTKKYSEDDGVTRLSDLKGKKVVLAAAPDCSGRLDCEGGLTDKYGIDVTKLLPLGYASDQTYKSVIDGESQLGETSTTDGTLDSQGLVVLDDDQHIQPAQNLVPAVSSDYLADHPDLPDVLDPLMKALTTEKLTELNGKVSVDREKPADVAHEFLTDEGLL